MAKKQLTYLIISIVVAVIFFLIFPVPSQQRIQLDDCSDLVNTGPCAPSTIDNEYKPLVVVLTDESELLAANSTNHIYLTAFASIVIGGTYYYFANREHKKTKSPSKTSPKKKTKAKEAEDNQ